MAALNSYDCYYITKSAMIQEVGDYPATFVKMLKKRLSNAIF